MIRPNLLLLDDDIELSKALGKYLSKHGYSVVCAGNPVEAVDLIQKRAAFDLVITDLQMPGMSGFTMVWALKNARPELPVIVITAYASPAAREEALNLGAATVLDKPVDTALLLETISAALAARKATAS